MKREIKKTVLIITDGIGCKPNSSCNAFKDATKPTFDKLLKDAPKTLICTHGVGVGLPDGQMGNSEVGHMTIGSGRVLYQDLVKITLAIKDGSIKENKALIETLDKGPTVHLVGLLSDGGVHSHIEHTIELALIAKSMNKRVYLHLITDGRDVSPTSAGSYIKQIESICDDQITIATIGGRFYTMDRDNRWERIEKGYQAIVNATPCTALSAVEYISQSYKEGVRDEFIVPVSLNRYKGMRDNDSVIVTNFRSDRAREIVSSLGEHSFNKFATNNVSLHIATMTQYDASFEYPIMFKKTPPKNTLADVVSQAGLTQLHTAETEKYAHVTFFFNGGVEQPLKGEKRVLIPSPNIKTYDMQPEMSAPAVGDAVTDAMNDGYDLVIVNFANGDMVGHTGNYEAACEAVNAVDTEIAKIIKKSNESCYDIVLTSDHGNCEEMRDSDGNILTNHTVGDVWCYVISDKVKSLQDGGGLNNVAPTVLKVMGLEIPSEMDEPLF